MMILVQVKLFPMCMHSKITADLIIDVLQSLAEAVIVTNSLFEHPD